MKIEGEVVQVCSTLHDAGYEAYLVGGAVRDSLLGREVHDWDIATNAKPQEIINKRLFPRVIETGLKHGTVTALIDGISFEITTYRKDGDYTDGRRPNEVEFSKTIEEDLARRDFTINAIAYDPLRDRIVDPFDGIGDLSRGLIKAVGNHLQRFSEDGLRCLRAARFASTLEFHLELSTLVAIRSCLDTYAKVAVERVQAEWLKIMASKTPSLAFRIMAETDMLEVTVPEMIPMIGCRQNKYHAYDVWTHTLRTLDATPKEDVILRVAALFHDIGKPASKGVNPVTDEITFYDHDYVSAEIANVVLERMKFSTEDRIRIVHLVRHHFIRYDRHWSASTIRRWARKVGLENVPSLLTLAKADIVGKGPAKTGLDSLVIDELAQLIETMKIEEQIPMSTKSLAINGSDVMTTLGIGPGPKVGTVLKLLMEVITDDPEKNTREALLSIVGDI
jgi:tRNA nucleotidyltransferase (CCA-adding enzyme)